MLLLGQLLEVGNEGEERQEEEEQEEVVVVVMVVVVVVVVAVVMEAAAAVVAAGVLGAWVPAAGPAPGPPPTPALFPTLPRRVFPRERLLPSLRCACPCVPSPCLTPPPPPLPPLPPRPVWPAWRTQGDLPDIRDVVFIRTALARGCDLYEPLNLTSHINNANLDVSCTWRGRPARRASRRLAVLAVRQSIIQVVSSESQFSGV